MKAVDTNVLARFFVDDPDDAEAQLQRPAAVRAMSGRVYVPMTVLLEFEWVLRGFYRLQRADVVRVLRALAGMENAVVESRDETLAALDACEHQNLDFADALHLARSARCSAFVTFDRRLVPRLAGAGFGVAVEAP